MRIVDCNGKRRFELPGVHELSKEQEAVNYLPLEGRYLIVGGPGTGKSVVALMRSRLLREKKKNYLFLVYNVLLEKASHQLYPGVAHARWISWLNGQYHGLFGQCPPRHGQDWADIAWPEVQRKFLSIDALPWQNRFFVVDEGQDMPPEFYETLLLGTENIFVTADQNQQITDHNATIQQLQAVLGVEVMHLTENFRQRDKGYHVAKLANEFYCDPATQPPNLPSPPSISADTPWLFSYSHETVSLETVLQRIVKRVLRDPTELIGILTHKNTTRQEYCDGLRRARETLSEQDPTNKKKYECVSIATYSSDMIADQRGNLRFDKGGIMVINAQSCKGLEFDTVFIADVNDFPHIPDTDQTKRLFYVMVSRARERIFLLRNLGAPNGCPVEDNGMLPQNAKILRRNYP